MLLKDKKGVILGIANERSIAFDIAKYSKEHGANFIVSSLRDVDDDKNLRNLEKVKKTLSNANISFDDCISLNAVDENDIKIFFEKIKSSYGKIDFLVHSIAYAPMDDLKKGCLLDVSQNGFLEAMNTSVYSFIMISKYAKEILNDGASIITLSYLGGEKVVPGYNFMGVCKSALESSVQYLAYELGSSNIRVNAISAGIKKTLSSYVIKNISEGLKASAQIAPMKRIMSESDVGNSAVYLLSDLSSGVTGETLHVDCGVHILSATSMDTVK